VGYRYAILGAGRQGTAAAYDIGVFGDADDVRAHGQDERIAAVWFYDGLEFCYRLVKRLTASEVM